MSSREEQMSLKMELEPRSASLVPTMAVTIVEQGGVLVSSDWRIFKFSVGGFFSVLLASRKHHFGNAEKWGLKHILLFCRQVVSSGFFPLCCCGCVLLQLVICLFRCLFGLLTLRFSYQVLSIVFFYWIGYIISPEVCSGFK